jgi:fibronectin type 3 domain-containing protein
LAKSASSLFAVVALSFLAPYGIQAQTPPSAPAALQATPTSASKVGLTWSAAASSLPIVSYHLYRGSSVSTLAQSATTAKTSYTDASVSAGTTYYYGVEAQDSNGNYSAMSAAAPAAVPTPPSAPTSLVPTPSSATRVILTWSAAASGGLPVTYYQVFRGNSPSTLSKVATVTQATYTDTSVNSGTTYYYGAEAQDSGGDVSPMSAAAPAVVPTPPSAPTGLVATSTSATMSSLTWNASASGGLPVLYYEVFRGTSPSSLSKVATVTQTSATDTSLVPGTAYYYAVEAEDSGADYSAKSAVVPATQVMLPSAPTGLATAVTSSIPAGAAQATYSVSLTWSASVSGGLPVEFYQVSRGTSPSSLSQVGSVEQTSYTDNSVSAATTYYYAVVAADPAGDLSAMSARVPATIGNSQAAGLFNILPMNIDSFSPSSTDLSGLPQTSIGSALFDDVGYQSGIVLNGKMIYNANEVWPGGSSSWMGAVGSAVPMPVFMSYNTTQLLGGFNLASNWTYFDASTLSWYNKGTPQPANTGNQCIDPANNPYCLNIVGGYMGRSAYVGNIYYPTPNFHNAYMVFLSYDSSKAINDPTAYQTFVPPGYYESTMGQQYGWCSSVTDGRFVYYAPLGNPVTGNSGNIFRYDTTQPFSNLATGGQTAAWQNFNMQTTPSNPGGISPNAAGFQSVAYDGTRYVYYIPFQQTLIVRYDTWNGGSAPNPAGFTVAANYTTFDPTQLGTSGYPAVAGLGNTANLAGFTGSQVVWDAANQNEYLYLVPWGTYPNNASNPTLQSTAARVRIGVMTGSNWRAVDITSTATSPAYSTPNWEMYNLTLLMQNPAWASNWPLLQTIPQLSTQSSMAGWQESWVATSNSEGATFPPRVGFVPDTSSFLVEHDVGHSLSDPTGWYVTMIPSNYNNGTMGGGYDAANGILYPASPNVPLFAFQF